MSVNVKWWKPLPKIPKIEDMLPIIGILPDGGTLALKNNHQACVFEIRGRDYAGMDSSMLETFHRSRNEMIRNMPSNVIITAHTRRIKEIDKSAETPHDNETANAINQIWSSRFKYSFRNKHYLVITTSNAGMLDDLAALQSYGRDKAVRAGSILDEASRELKSRLSDYRPKRLSHSDLCSFLASYLNGRQCRQKHINYFDDLLTGSDIVFPENKPYQAFEGSSIRYAAWLSIKSYEDNTTPKMIDEIMKQQIELTLYSQWQTIAPDKAFSILDDKRRTARSWTRYNDETDAEFDEFFLRAEAKELGLCYFGFALQVFSDNLEILEKNIEKITEIVEYYGFRTIRERNNLEPLYWSMLPSLEHLMIRKRFLSSENAADFATFSAVGEGLERCSWGETCVTRFLTSANTEYRFCFHSGEDDRALGHTLVFGSSNSGKTTLIDFLLSQSLRFNNLRVIIFDRR